MSHYWCFTLNNYTDPEVDQIMNLNCNYLIFGKEVGENGTKHLQGYVEFPMKKKLPTVKKLMPRAHLENRKGNAMEAAEYCRKDGDIFEKGEISNPESGKRTDLALVKEAILDGKGMKDVVCMTNSFQAIRFAETLLKYVEKKRDWPVNVRWYYGPTGSGKTRRAMAEAKDPYVSGKNLKWWEGYDAHEDVIIDDFRADFCTFHELLRILDRYEYRVEIKGGSRQLLARNIWITSCHPPDGVYSVREDIGQLLRRISLIEKIDPESDPKVGGNTGPDCLYDFSIVM